MRNTTQNQENQENQKRTFNHNEVNNQYEKNLEILKKRIKYIEKDRNMSKNDKGKNLSNEFFNFISNNLPKNEELTDLINIISETIKNNQDSAGNIVFGFIKGCISQRKDLKDEYIGNAISKIVNNNQNSAFDIIAGFTQGYFLKENDLIKISGIISKIVKNNKDSAINIIDVFTQCCISEGYDLTSIGEAVTKIIKTNGIKNDQDLVFNVINGFVKGYLTLKPDNIKDIAESFSNLLNKKINKDNFGENEQAIKEKLKPIFSLIVSRYFINTLTNSSNKQLSEDNKKTEEQLSGDNKKETETEKQLRIYYNELFHEENNKTIESFKDIPLKELSCLQDEYLKERFKNIGVDSGMEYETFLKTACNLIPKSEGNKEPTVADVEKQKNIFKDLKFIHLNNNDGITSKKELFEKIGLKPEDFGKRRKGEFSNFSIVYCGYLGHGFVMIIDKTKGYNEAISPKTESIYLIDSSQGIKKVKNNYRFLLGNKQDIFNSTLTLNDHHYQENGTCWLNAMSAVGFLLEKQQECIAKQKQKQRKQVKQTEQQVKKPYGLSIKELLRGFGKKRNSRGKIVNSLLENKTYPSAGNNHYSSQYYQPSYNNNSQYVLYNYPVRYPSVENAYYFPQYYQPSYNNNSQYVSRNYPVRYPFAGNTYYPQQDHQHLYYYNSPQYVSRNYPVRYPSAGNNHYSSQYYQPSYNNNSQYVLYNYPVRYPSVENAYYFPQYYQPFYNNNSQYVSRNYPVRYPSVENAYNTCNYSLKENISSFEQGICDYSTEHFYTLVNHSKEEKYFITKLLAEKVEENIKSQEKLKETSEQLEKLKEMSERLDASAKKQYEALTANQQEISKEEFDKKQNKERIIYENYLAKSLEQIAKDENKLKKFCTKLSILDLNQGENSSNRKQSMDLECIASAEGNIDSIYNYPPNSKQHKGKNGQQYIQ